jgi:hypothetical protein
VNLFPDTRSWCSGCVMCSFLWAGVWGILRHYIFVKDSLRGHAHYLLGANYIAHCACPLCQLIAASRARFSQVILILSFAPLSFFTNTKASMNHLRNVQLMSDPCASRLNCTLFSGRLEPLVLIHFGVVVC